MRGDKVNGVRWYSEITDARRVREIADQADPRDPLTEDGLRALKSNKDVVIRVHIAGQRVTGFIAYETRSKSIELRRLAVDPTYRRQGIGTVLAAAARDAAINQGRLYVAATVRETDDAAWAFLRAIGYRDSMLLRGHYPDTAEDGYRFSLAVGEYAESIGKHQQENRP